LKISKWLSGRQVLDQIFADESAPEDSESSEEMNVSNSPNFHLESDDDLDVDNLGGNR